MTPPLIDAPDFRLQTVQAHGIELNVATAGSGPPILLLHGWPHTWFLWRKVMPALAREHQVIAPDMRGVGGSTKAADGYDLHGLSDDAAALLEALGVSEAVTVGIDAGAPVAWMLAMRHPARVRKLVVMESLIGALPGGEAFLARGPPWWFGFHAVPGLPETVLAGREAEYLEWFYRSGTAGKRGIDPVARDAFVAAYTGREALRCGFEYYRAFPRNAEQITAAAARRRLTQPTLAIGGNTVGEATYRQLRPLADELTGHIIPDCGHIIPEDQPDALVALLLPFAA